jgi:hypothetical protein
MIREAMNLRFRFSASRGAGFSEGLWPFGLATLLFGPDVIEIGFLGGFIIGKVP